MIIHDTATPIMLSLLGKHNVMNALAAAAAATAVGESPEAISQGLAQCRSVSLRQEIVRVGDGLTIINDCYNANPASMDAALATFLQIKGKAQGIVVLGDMLELGSSAAEFHRELGRKVAQTNTDYLVVIGDFAADVKAGALSGGLSKEAVLTPSDHETLTSMLLTVIGERTVMLVKGSRKMALERIVSSIIRARGVGEPRTHREH